MMADDYINEPIDLCACYEPIVKPPRDLVEMWHKSWQKALAFKGITEQKVGNTWYLVETTCAGNEPLVNKVKRLVFTDEGKCG